MASDVGCTLQDHFGRKVQKQLDAIESIREDLTAEGISVPGVVVVGAQVRSRLGSFLQPPPQLPATDDTL